MFNKPILHLPLKGKKALVVGLPNQAAIALRCAHAYSQQGAKVAITYLNEKAFPHVEPLALGSLAEALGGLDVIVFSAKDAEQSSLVRSEFSRAAAWLGIEFDNERDTELNIIDQACTDEKGGCCSAWFLPQHEKLTIARQNLPQLVVA